MTASHSERSRRVLLARPRGYCAGVDRAVVTVEKALDMYGAPVYVRKEIVHNRYVVEQLSARGAIFVDETDEGARGRPGGVLGTRVSPAVHEQGRRPAAAHHRTPRAHWDEGAPGSEALTPADDYDILLIGHAGHEEVDGTTGEAPSHVQLVEPAGGRGQGRDPRSVEGDLAVPRRPCRSTRPWSASISLRDRFPGLQNPPSDDICLRHPESPGRGEGDGTGECDVVLVVGSQELVQLETPGRGRGAGRRRGLPTGRLCERDRREVVDRPRIRWA